MAITKRIDELRRIVQNVNLHEIVHNVNIHDGNRILLMLIVEELSYLHDEVESWRQIRESLRKNFL